MKEKNIIIYALIIILAIFILADFSSSILGIYLKLTGNGVGQNMSQVRIADLRQITADLPQMKHTVPAPKSLVGKNYYDSFNQVVNEISLIDSSFRNDIAPLIAKIKEDLDKNDLSDLSAVKAKIASLNKAQQGREALLAGYLDTLNASGASIEDKETKEMTADLVKSGSELNETYISYSAIIYNILYGSVTKETNDRAKETGVKMAEASDKFKDASGKLMVYFMETIKTDLKKLSIKK